MRVREKEIEYVKEIKREEKKIEKIMEDEREKETYVNRNIHRQRVIQTECVSVSERENGR